MLPTDAVLLLELILLFEIGAVDGLLEVLPIPLEDVFEVNGALLGPVCFCIEAFVTAEFPWPFILFSLVSVPVPPPDSGTTTTAPAAVGTDAVGGVATVSFLTWTESSTGVTSTSLIASGLSST